MDCSITLQNVCYCTTIVSTTNESATTDVVSAVGVGSVVVEVLHDVAIAKVNAKAITSDKRFFFMCFCLLKDKWLIIVIITMLQGWDSNPRPWDYDSQKLPLLTPCDLFFYYSVASRVFETLFFGWKPKVLTPIRTRLLYYG